MLDSSITNSRYAYTRDHKWPSKVVDTHQIVVRKSGAKGFFVYSTSLLIVASALYFYLVKVPCIQFSEMCVSSLLAIL